MQLDATGITTDTELQLAARIRNAAETLYHMAIRYPLFHQHPATRSNFGQQARRQINELAAALADMERSEP